MSEFPRELLTPRLRLRQWRDDDAVGLARIAQDPGYQAYMPPLDLSAARDLVARFRERWAETGVCQWAAEDLETGGFLGRIGILQHSDWPLEPLPSEVGWTLAPEARGRGLASEGGRAAIDAAFAHLAVDHVISITRPDNWPSRRVMERLGLTLRGTAYWREHDSVWYAVDRTAWG